MQLHSWSPEKFCPNNTHQGAAIRDGVVLEIQRLSSRLGTEMSTWTPESVLFRHSGILEISLQVPEPRREDFYCNYIHESLLLHVELIRVADIRFVVFSLAAEVLCQRNTAGKKNNNFWKI